MLRRPALALAICLVLAAASPAAWAQERLFRITTLETGVVEFDMEIVEIAREPRVSVLTVRGFHQRPQAGTRWLMCMANTLAVLRGFDYWTLVYPDTSSETVLVGFPADARERMGDRDPRFASKLALQVVAPIERGVRLCRR